MPSLAKNETLPVARARAGDAEAWDVLFRRYQLPLYTYVKDLIRDEQTSLDIVQETFIRAVRHIGSLRDDKRFGAWLYRIAHQRCQDHWRKLRPTEPIDDLPGGEAVELDSDLSPLETLLATESEGRLLDAIDALSEEHRSVILLHCLEEFSLGEIAEVTGVAVGTVKSRLFNARAKLRARLALEYLP